MGWRSFLERIRDETGNGRIPAAAEPETGDTEGRGQGPRAGDSDDPDRVVQGALKLIVEPIFEADFQAGSYGYRPQRSATTQ